MNHKANALRIYKKPIQTRDTSTWLIWNHTSSWSNLQTFVSSTYGYLKWTNKWVTEYLRQVCTKEGRRHLDFTRNGKINSAREDQTSSSCVTTNHKLLPSFLHRAYLAFLLWPLTTDIDFSSDFSYQTSYCTLFPLKCRWLVTHKVSNLSLHKSKGVKNDNSFYKCGF